MANVSDQQRYKIGVCFDKRFVKRKGYFIKCPMCRHSPKGEKDGKFSVATYPADGEVVSVIQKFKKL